MSATDELRRLLDERGVEYFKHEDGEPLRKLEKADEPATSWHMGGASVCAVPIEDSDLFDLWIDHCTPEQAIAATLRSDEPPYDELLRCLENDWHISASWDGLRKFWCIELTEEGVKLRDATHGTLTAEQVREAVEASTWAETSTLFEFGDSSWQAIADELNEALGGGECELVYGENDHGDDGWWCQSCGEWFAASFRHTGRNNIIEPSYCQHCGKAAKR